MRSIDRHGESGFHLFSHESYVESKAFSEVGFFGCELSCGTSHIVRHCYDVAGSMLSIYCLPLSDNWGASWRVIMTMFEMPHESSYPNKPFSENALFSIPLPGSTVSITDFAYADDIALLGDSFEAVQDALEEVERNAAAVGLRINAAKTKLPSAQVAITQQRQLISEGVLLEEEAAFK